MLFFVQVSPVATEQECMSLHWFGTTNDRFASAEKLFCGNCAQVFPVSSGTFLNANHGLCFCAYWPFVQAVDPSAGRSSLYVANVFPAAISSWPRFAAVIDCGV